jgi:hypothetical protein
MRPRLRGRYATRPSPQKPNIIIAHVDNPGTAEVPPYVVNQYAGR